MKSALLLALCSAAAAAAPVVATAQANPQIRTTTGVIAGITATSGTREFRGVPFAAPPVRELRWQPPQPVHGWTGVRAADRFADQCMQARVFSDMVFRNAGTSEDCLYLNVWAPPGAGAARMPVLVYFFGGGFVAGDGSEPRYDGESLARRGVVVVTTSYRLGIFGFFAHPELTRESAHRASGNYGLMDQAAALRWVHDNIAAFGGDPSHVTIAGESAGSMSVSALMASPLAKNLIAGAIGESGALLSQRLPAARLADAEREGLKFAEAVSAPPSQALEALRSLSAMELLAASMRPGMPRFSADVDGWFMPESPDAIYAAGRQAHVPLLAGWNTEESSARAIVHDGPTPENVPTVLTSMFAANAGEAAHVFPAATADQAVESMTNLASDRFIAFATWKWLDEHARTSGQPVFRYLYARPRPAVTGEAPPGPAPRGAVHSAEIEYALGNLATNKVFAWTPDDERVSQTMESYFANFIRTGNPNGSGLPQWPVGKVGADGRVMHMRIDVDTRAEPEDRARYLFLDRAWSARPE